RHASSLRDGVQTCPLPISCSSALCSWAGVDGGGGILRKARRSSRIQTAAQHQSAEEQGGDQHRPRPQEVKLQPFADTHVPYLLRSEERRVGKESESVWRTQ